MVCSKRLEKIDEELARYPMGYQAWTLSNPNWSPDIDDTDNWNRNHFITCIVEGLRRP